MIDNKFATKQAVRFNGLKGFPRQKEGLAELIKAFESAASYSDAEDFAEDWLRQQDECPKPSHVYRALNTKKQLETNNPYCGKKPPIVCKKCGDNGTVFNKETKQHERCTCANGIVYPENLLRLLNGPGHLKREKLGELVGAAKGDWWEK